MSGDGVEPVVPGALAARLVPDELWEIVAPLLPSVKVRPQGGGARRLSDRPILVGVVYVVTTGTAWRKLPPWCAGLTHATLYRRFCEWTTAQVWDRLLRAIPVEHGDQCWCRVVAVLAKQHAAEQPFRQVHRKVLAAETVLIIGDSRSVMNGTEHAVFH